MDETVLTMLSKRFPPRNSHHLYLENHPAIPAKFRQTQYPIPARHCPPLPELSRPLPDHRQPRSVPHQRITERLWPKNIRLLPPHRSSGNHHRLVTIETLERETKQKACKLITLRFTRFFMRAGISN